MAARATGLVKSARLSMELQRENCELTEASLRDPAQLDIAFNTLRAMFLGTQSKSFYL